MKSLNYGAAALFLVAAALQFNDPDPLYWILVYAGTAIVALGEGLGRHDRLWTGICMGAVAAGLISTAAAFGDYLRSGDPTSILDDMSEGGHIEESREFLGLLLAFVLLTAYSVRHSRRRG